MLGSMKIVSSVPTRDPKNARSFYEDVLGLRFLSEDPFALEFDANGIVVRITNVSSVPGFAPAPFTILGWEVPDIKDVARGLRSHECVQERPSTCRRPLLLSGRP